MSENGTQVEAALEHAKHLRAIHFALVVASLVIAISATLITDNLYDAAADEVIVIEKMVALAGPIDELFEEIVGAAVEGSAKKNEISLLRLTISDDIYAKHQLPNQEEELLWTAKFPKPSESRYIEIVTRNYWTSAIGVFPAASFTPDDLHPTSKLDFEVTNSLDQFRSLWNSLNSLRQFDAIIGFSLEDVEEWRYSEFLVPILDAFVNTRPKSVEEGLCDVYSRTKQSGDLLTISRSNDRSLMRRLANFMRSDTSRPSIEDVEFRIEEWPPNDCRKLTDSSATLGAPYALALNAILSKSNPESRRLRVRFPAAHVSIPINGLEHFIEKTGSAQPTRAAVFDLSFPALSKVLKDFNEINLAALSVNYLSSPTAEPGSSDLSNLIRRLKTLGGKQFNLFGVAAPGSVIKTWGGAILTSIMIYFYLHIKAFTRTHASRFSSHFPWIGVYETDLPSGILLIISSTCLPLCVALWLAVDSYPDKSFTSIFSYVTAGTVAAIAIPLYFAISQMRVALQTRQIPS